MTVLHSVDFFPSGNASVAIEPRLPQADFPEHHHDFHEIVIVEHGTGIHVFNGQPYTITGGTVCFVRDHDRHLYEHTDNLCLTNVLYRSPDRFQFLAGLNQLLPQELDGQYPSHWRVNHSVLQQNLENSASRLNLLLAWLEDHFADEVNWDAVADQFSLSLRTLHRQLKQQTGLTPQRYLNRLRLMKARHLLRHSEASVTDIAYRCGFSDSNHFSTLFRREFNWSPRDIRQGRDGFLQ
ncbi:TPA: HTH-type transcriptional activator RhaS [Escherichia coli]|nr:HTH-type transcriptional activator RhaS [Escherichia coli]